MSLAVGAEPVGQIRWVGLGNHVNSHYRHKFKNWHAHAIV